MKKNSSVYIIVFLLLAVVIASFIYNSGSLLIKRTIAYDLPEDSKIVELHRTGFLFWTSSYEAKIKIPHDNPEELIETIYLTYGEAGAVMPYDTYNDFAQSVFLTSNNNSIIPVVEPNTNVNVQVIAFADGVSLTQIIASANESEAYLYIYWSK